MISRKKSFGSISVGEIHHILCDGEVLTVEVISFGNLKRSSRGLVEKPLVSVRKLGENHNRCYDYRDIRWLDRIPEDFPFWNSDEWLSYTRKKSCGDQINY